MDSIINTIMMVLYFVMSIFMIRIWILDGGDMTKEDTFILLFNLNKKMTKLLTFLKGKKTTIGAVLALVITYCLTKGYIDNDLALLLSSLLVALGLTSNVATAKMVK